MRAARIHEHGGPSALQIEEVPEPEFDADEVLIDVQAAGVNPFDAYVRAGDVHPPNGLPHVPGGDVGGVVAAVGETVETVDPGDGVFATGLGLDRQGSYGEQVAVPVDRVAPLPDSVSFVAAAAAAEPFSTSLQALVDRGGLSMGDVCLVQGASGGVGHAAVQLASRAGAFVVATARSGGPSEVVRDLGADAVVDYRRDDLSDAVLDATGGRPIDVVVETNADTNIAADLETLADGGRVVVLGESDPITIGPASATLAKKRGADLRFVSHMAGADHHAAYLERTGELLAENTVEVLVAATYPLEDVSEAQRHCMTDGVIGKVVLDI